MGDAGKEAEAAGLKSVKDQLKAINETLAKLAAAFDAQPFQAQAARDLITALLVSKMDLLSALPELLGVSFFSWYLDLATLDDLPNQARHQTFNEPFDFQKEKDRIMGWLEEAKRTKERLESELPEDSDANNERYGRSLRLIRQHLKDMNEKLQRIIKGYPIGQYRELELRMIIDEITKLKYQIIGLLPTALGVSFSDWYDVLHYLDWVPSSAAEEAAKKVPDVERAKRFIDLAKRNKEGFERKLPH